MRKERGITQQEMAELLNTSQPIVSDYERGELRLHGELIVKIAGILGVSGDELLGLERVSRSSAVSNRRLAWRIQQIDQLPKRGSTDVTLPEPMSSTLRGSNPAPIHYLFLFGLRTRSETPNAISKLSKIRASQKRQPKSS